jgi:transcriptional regulator with XRE-family HTH domain
MPTEPAVLQRLKALGLDQKTIAQYLGASPASVSGWCNGRTPFEGPWQIEATILLAVLQEHLAHGGTLATFRHEPGLTLVSGTPQRMSFFRITPAKAPEYHKLQEEIRELGYPHQARASWGWMTKEGIEQLAAWIEPIDPLTWHPTARELDAQRRLVEHLQGTITSLLLLRAQTTETEAGNADETA